MPVPSPRVVRPASGDELGRPATEIADEKRARGHIEIGGGSRVGQPPLLLPGEQLRPDSEDHFGSVEEFGGVRRVASPAEVVHARRAPATTPCSSRISRYRRSTVRVRAIASGASAPEASTPWPNRVIIISRVTASPARSTMSNRVEFVPQSIAATGPSISPASCAAVQRPTGSAPPARYHARCAWRHLTPSARVPPTPPC